MREGGEGQGEGKKGRNRGEGREGREGTPVCIFFLWFCIGAQNRLLQIAASS